ncbi:hypothetical protein SAMN05216298_3390 [Glycomyces sambucus]|uniref:PPE family protein n=1 Tax=Glycomyces sambucus TaxID=380244 RepID=A0A1G9J3K3_9ACTN|nr:hypothetical protein [Glycomyces sambucus]SDL31911.1 hypothetical protein SAMN05216298_3390 [Glycomyces sambucus]
MADEFEKEEYGDAQEGMANSAIQARINQLMKTPTCSLGECTNKTVDPAEEAWLKLMSAVPKGAGATANIRPSRDIEGYALPDGQSVQSLVASLRPSNPDDHAILVISQKWKDLAGTFVAVPEDLQAGLTALSGEWEGADYDAFEEQVQTVIKNCNKVLKDIEGEGGGGGAVKNLEDKATDILNQQGGDECPYPSPKFHLEDAAACSHKIHIRPPYFPSCEVFADDETKVAMEWAGFDSNIVDEVQEERERIYNMYKDHTNQYPDYEEDGLRGEELAKTRADEYAKRATDDLGTDGQDQLQEQASIVNEDITDRTSNTNMAVSEIKPEAVQSEPTTFNKGDVEPPGGLDGGGAPPGGGGAPPGLGDMKPPGGMKPVSPPSPNLPDTDTGNPDLPGNGDLPGNSDIPGPGDLDDNPWEPTSPDPDDLPSGGLAGGGGGGLGGGIGGGGLGPGGGAGLGGGGLGGGAGGGIGGGVGAGGMGGMMGAGGAGRGAGGVGGGRGAGGRGPGGMGRGAGAGGMGRGGMAGGMMGAGGGRGMGGVGEDGQETGTWLTEDDDVWGIGNENEDPYA